ncbi:hypothetical protein K3181_09540 [Qipengyuania sp. YG27]|uniref:DUF4383 domain-containing protein n=1 Tax=Qipengyuania mesophila TaxID=2867246 RepID=A0ABS7JVT5_9SPHN|nr:hypothetical protein [Qipengyuania mesophila]MBX7501684.1 hypothetical protein [Qipengyuania mesophila]
MKTGIVGGLVAGLIFVLVEMILVPTVGGGSAFGPPRMIAAIAMGEEVLPPPATFDAGIFTVGMLVHFALSAVLGVIFALFINRFQRVFAAKIGAGLVFGLLVYLVNFYGLTALYPWFEMARNAITIVAHLIFGGVLGWWMSAKSVAV